MNPVQDNPGAGKDGVRDYADDSVAAAAEGGGSVVDRLQCSNVARGCKQVIN